MHLIPEDRFWLVDGGLRHINSCGLFNAIFCLYIYIYIYIIFVKRATSFLFAHC